MTRLNELAGFYRGVSRFDESMDAFARLKFESGVHCVKRVPVTESGGRIHTSTVTVAVFPEAEEIELDINPSDLRIDVFHASGHGGQGVAGMRVTIIDGRLADVQVGGKPVNPRALYTVATSDYLSGGTDHMEALTRYVDYWKSDLLIRYLYLNAVQTQDTIRAAVDGRMTIEP